MLDDYEFIYPVSETMYISYHERLWDVEYSSKIMILSEAAIDLKTSEIKQKESAQTEF